MAGTKSGGTKAATTNKLKFGADFYVKIGKLGGAASTTGGFYGDPALASRAGSLGGLIGRKGKKLTQAQIDKIKRQYRRQHKPLWRKILHV